MAKEKTLNMTSYHSKLVGVTFNNRQDTIGILKGDEELRFRREPENEFDKNAVAVDVLLASTVQGHSDNMDVHEIDEWLPIGYIARDKNSELAQLLTDGREAHITMNEITGGGEGSSYGVNVYIEYEKERRLTRTANAILVKDYFGNEIFYDDVLHEYTNALGEIYLSGSAFASEDDFDGEYWANYFVDAYKLKEGDKQRILDMWETNGEASRNFGTALHAAIELYGKYHDIADKIDVDLKTGKRKKVSAKVDKNSALSKLPYLQQVALSFFTGERLAEKAEYEVLVVDHKNKRAGRIDRLVIGEDGRLAVRDLKTNNKLAKKDLFGYTKQLSFYADLLLANGVTLSEDPIVIHHWNENGWVDVKLEKIDTLDVLPTSSLSRQG